VQQQVAGNLKEEVPKKEYPGHQPKLLGRNGQLLVHRQRRKPDVDPVQKRNNVKKKNEGDNPHPHSMNNIGFVGHDRRICFVRQDYLSVHLPRSKRLFRRRRRPKECLVRIAVTLWWESAPVK